MTDNKVNPRHVAYTGSLRASGDESGDAWFTPPNIIELVRNILGGKISLDPFSSIEANRTIGAERIFMLEDNAFEQKDWKAKTLFMNPPYSRGLCQKAIGRFLQEFSQKRIRCAVILVNNMTDTAWFHRLAEVAQRRCDLRGRISFVTTDNKRISGNTRGQTIFLLSHNNNNAINRFDALMADHGLVYKEAVGSVYNETARKNGRVHRRARGKESNGIPAKLGILRSSGKGEKTPTQLGNKRARRSGLVSQSLQT